MFVPHRLILVKTKVRPMGAYPQSGTPKSQHLFNLGQTVKAKHFSFLLKRGTVGIVCQQQKLQLILKIVTKTEKRFKIFGQRVTTTASFWQALLCKQRLDQARKCLFGSNTLAYYTEKAYYAIKSVTVYDTCLKHGQYMRYKTFYVDIFGLDVSSSYYLQYDTRGLYFKTFYGRNLQIFIISLSFCLWQAFPA